MQRILYRAAPLLRKPVNAAPLRRALSSNAAAAPATLSAVPAAAPPAPAPEPATSRVSTSSIWDSIVAFVGGIAIGGAYFIYLSQTEGLSSGATEAVAAVRAEALASNAETDRRLALLEHQIVALKTELSARS